MRIKICGITRPDQAQAIAQLGVDTLGFICVPQTPRYIAPDLIRAIAETLTAASLPVARIGVFANASLEEVIRIAKEARFTGVQLHGQEDPTFCQQLRQQLPEMETIKSFRIQTTADLESTVAYEPHVDTLLLDAYHPGKLGGTGQAIDWSLLQHFSPQRPWLLAGGLRPDNVAIALSQTTPHGIDLSSGVERAPGDKDVERVALLVEQVRGGGTEKRREI